MSLGHLVEQGGGADAGGGLENLEPEHVEILLRLLQAATVDPGAAGRVVLSSLNDSLSPLVLCMRPGGSDSSIEV